MTLQEKLAAELKRRETGRPKSVTYSTDAVKIADAEKRNVDFLPSEEDQLKAATEGEVTVVAVGKGVDGVDKNTKKYTRTQITVETTEGQRCVYWTNEAAPAVGELLTAKLFPLPKEWFHVASDKTTVSLGESHGKAYNIVGNPRVMTAKAIEIGYIRQIGDKKLALAVKQLEAAM